MKAHSVSIRTILICLGLCLASFYAGLTLGMHSIHLQCRQCLENANQPRSVATAKEDIAQQWRRTKQQGAPKISLQTKKEQALPKICLPAGNNQTTTSMFTSTTKSLVVDMARVDRDEFLEKFNVGAPIDPTQPGNEEVVVFYSNEKALPTKRDRKLSVDQATQHCNTLKVVFTAPRKQRECLAVVGQFESHDVHKWMRLPDGKGKVNQTLPLRRVTRTHNDAGVYSVFPREGTTKEHDYMLQDYLTHLADVLKELKPIAKKVARDNTIVVMVCNHGQSELLMNFVCSAQLRGFDLSQVLVFATDEETKQLAEGLGLAAFYDERNYKALPKKAARVYGDKVFSSMMMAKVFCVHMISQLGYDLLFQDVDIVWYRNPLEYFYSQPKEDELFFQDDGARSLRYAPYSPNSGFYFARNTKKTRRFFRALMLEGDRIMQTRSHQEVLNSVLSAYVSQFDLRVKVLESSSNYFPGGFHYHRRQSFMKELVQGKADSYMFHMSWTNNKDNKLLFLRQMGEWFVQDECIGSSAGNVLSTSKGKSLDEACCASEPLVSCHYRDKPSKIPCKDSPPIDKNKPSWW